MPMMSPLPGQPVSGPPDPMREAMEKKRQQVAMGAGQSPTPTSKSTINQQGAGPAQPAARPAAAPQQQTFQQMSAAGQARPAPPAPAPVTSVAQGWQAPVQATGDLKTVMGQALGNPSGYGQADVQKFYNTAAEGIDDQFAGDTRALKESLARSGLDESSVMAGKTYDLNVGKRSAMADLANKYGEQYANAYAKDRLGAINAANDMYKTDTDKSVADARINLDTSRLGLDTELGRGEINIKQQGVNNDTSRLALDSEIDRGKLGVDRSRLAFDERDSEAERERKRQEFEKNYGLDRDKFGQEQVEFDKNYGLDSRRVDNEGRRIDLTADDQSWRQNWDLLGYEGDTQTPWEDVPEPEYDPLMDMYPDYYGG